MYRFAPDQAVEQRFRAIALSQIDAALKAIDEPDDGMRSAVHEVRRRCKKLRGLLRLVRPAFDQFGQENGAIRDAAAMLSSARDAEVQRLTILSLAGGSDDAGLLEAIAGRLPKAPIDRQFQQLVRFGVALSEVRARVTNWTLGKDSVAPLLRGLRANYRDERRRMQLAERTRLAADMHEWRKANKYFGSHLALLRGDAEQELAGERETVDRLSLLLGLHHDLSVLSEAATETPLLFGDTDEVAVLLRAVRARSDEVEAAAFALGEKLLAETPRELERRFGEVWT